MSFNFILQYLCGLHWSRLERKEEEKLRKLRRMKLERRIRRRRELEQRYYGSYRRGI